MHRFILILCFAAVSGLADDHNDTDILKNLDVFEFEVAADPQISPDGSRVVYVRRSMDIMTDRPVSNLWIIDADGDNHRPLLSGSESYSSPRWSPSGDRIAYISRAEGRGPQIHVRWMDTGQTALLTNVRSSPSSMTWSPDGKAIAFSMFVKRDGKPLATPPRKPEGAEWAPPVTVIEEMPFRADGAGYLPLGNSHLFVLSAEGGTPRQLTSGSYNHGGTLAWTPDGDSILFAANRQEDFRHDPIESELWSVRLADGELTKLTDRNGPDFAPAISPDGRAVAYLGFDDKMMGYHNTGVYLMDLASGESRKISGDFDRSIGDVQWAGSSTRLYIEYDDRGKRTIATMSLRGEVSPIADDVGGVTLGRPYLSGGFSSAADGAFAYSAGQPQRPADVAVGQRNRDPRRITNLNEDALGHKALARIEEITWQSSVGDLEIQGWLAYPPNFDP